MRTDLPRHPAIVAAAGGAIAAFGLLMMAAWLFRVEGIVRLLPGFLMVFNTALGFAVAGLALAAGVLAPGWKRGVQAVAGMALGALGLVVLAEHVFGLSPGIDWAGLHAWLAEADGRPFPGRMSAATATTFVITGAILVLGPRVRNAAQALLVHALTAAVSVIGVVAIVGYLLNFAEIFDAYWLHQVALPTAIIFTILGGALWLNWRDEPWNRLRAMGNEDRRIALAGAAVLALSISATGIAVFSMMQASLERTLTGDLAFELQTRGRWSAAPSGVPSRRLRMSRTGPTSGGFTSRRPATRGNRTIGHSCQRLPPACCRRDSRRSRSTMPKDASSPGRANSLMRRTCACP